MSYTPGPWKVNKDFHPHVHGHDGSMVAVAQGHDKARDNARLISAAPDLLEALQEIVSKNELPSRHFFGGRHLEQYDNLVAMFERARSAIAKARGES